MACPETWMVSELCLCGVDPKEPRISLIELNRDINCHPLQGKQSLGFHVSQVNWPAKSERGNNNKTTWKNTTESRGFTAHSFWSGNTTKLPGPWKKQKNVTHTLAKTIFGYPSLDDLFVVFSTQRFLSSYYSYIQVPVGKYSHNEWKNGNLSRKREITKKAEF